MVVISAGEDITITIIILTPSRPDPTERRFRPTTSLSQVTGLDDLR
jgi:hypothetical protein